MNKLYCIYYYHVTAFNKMYLLHVKYFFNREELQHCIALDKLDTWKVIKNRDDKIQCSYIAI